MWLDHEGGFGWDQGLSGKLTKCDFHETNTELHFKSAEETPLGPFVCRDMAQNPGLSTEGSKKWTVNIHTNSLFGMMVIIGATIVPQRPAPLRRHPQKNWTNTSNQIVKRHKKSITWLSETVWGKPKDWIRGVSYLIVFSSLKSWKMYLLLIVLGCSFTNITAGK